MTQWHIKRKEREMLNLEMFGLKLREVTICLLSTDKNKNKHCKWQNHRNVSINLNIYQNLYDLFLFYSYKRRANVLWVSISSSLLKLK